ncbi:hypothetical protein E1176_10175 [Fulvivirga sp. RKSG066]|uniref:hypothetical protein n=1 Tax=Fulvivirga aurantia TaxID=2529383 RepID=UPI0012BC80A0|nr:hypothetical protein [Fulvivirga aurantia]MTI21386.1 hypothetical protein [Fulvivirga aurantia]
MLLFIYIQFVFKLPKKTKKRIIIAAILFIGGAMGLEMLGGNHAYNHGREGLTYAVLYTLEESLEMLGVIVLIYALLTFQSEKFDNLEVGLTVSEK